MDALTKSSFNIDGVRKSVKNSVFLTCLLFAYVNADTCSLYKFSSNRTIAVDSSATTIKIECDLLLKTLKENLAINDTSTQLQTDTYMSVRSLNIVVETGSSGSTNLNDCSSFKEISEKLSKPFQISYLDGVFQNLQVPKSDDDFSLNFKLALSQFLQVGVAQLMGVGPLTREATPYGSCNVNYSSSGQRDSNFFSATGLSDIKLKYDFDTNKTYIINSCSTLNKTNGLPSICNAIKEKNLQMDLKGNLSVIIASNKSSSIQRELLTKNAVYNPWKNSQAKVDLKHRSTVELKPIKQEDCDSAPTIDKLNVAPVTKAREPKVDNSLVDSKSSDPVKKSYTALACDPYNSNVELEIYKFASACSQA